MMADDCSFVKEGGYAWSLEWLFGVFVKGGMVRFV